MKNITKIQDDDSHWYWIPNNILDQFKKDLEEITDIDYMNNPDACDTFTYKYDQYRTMGSPDLMPDVFKKREMTPKQEQSDDTTKFCNEIRDKTMDVPEAESRKNPENLKQHQQIFFIDEVLPYQIKAISGRYAVCVRALDKEHDSDLLQHEVDMSAYTSFERAYQALKDSPIYTCIDFEEKIRGPHNLIFNIYEFDKQESIDELLSDLQSGTVQLSHRRKLELYIDWERTQDAAA